MPRLSLDNGGSITSRTMFCGGCSAKISLSLNVEHGLYDVSWPQTWPRTMDAALEAAAFQLRWLKRGEISDLGAQAWVCPACAKESK